MPWNRKDVDAYFRFSFGGAQSCFDELTTRPDLSTNRNLQSMSDRHLASMYVYRRLLGSATLESPQKLKADHEYQLQRARWHESCVYDQERFHEGRTTILRNEIERCEEAIRELAASRVVNGIRIERPGPKTLDLLQVTTWQTWNAGASTFDWKYDKCEQCYFLDGEVTIKTKDGEVSFGKGDFVTFPQGLSCTWVVEMPVKKHYRFG